MNKQRNEKTAYLRAIMDNGGLPKMCCRLNGWQTL